MPIYEYACGKCDHEFEVEQRISEDPVKTCPKCRSRKVKRLISVTSFSLKGGGWYSDGYSSPNGKSGADSSSEASSDSKSDSSSKSDTGSKSDSSSKGDSSAGKDASSKSKSKTSKSSGTSKDAA